MHTSSTESTHFADFADPDPDPTSRPGQAAQAANRAAAARPAAHAATASHTSKVDVTIPRLEGLSMDVTFEEFAATLGPRLRAALIAAYGLDAGVDAAAEALAYGWEHWDRVGEMHNPSGYLYRVGQTAARRGRRVQPLFPAPATSDGPRFEPGLLPALEALTEPQRVCVVMIHGYSWSQAEVAQLLGISASTVRTHLARALAHLQQALEVHGHAD